MKIHILYDNEITEDHINDLIFNMHKEDRDSIKALGGLSIEESVKRSIETSEEVFVALADETVLVLGGVSKGSLLSPCKFIWMLGTNEIVKYPRQFLRASKDFIDAKVEEHGHLINYVHEKNKRSIKWLKWLGFKVHESHLKGINGDLFHQVEIGK